MATHVDWQARDYVPDMAAHNPFSGKTMDDVYDAGKSWSNSLGHAVDTALSNPEMLMTAGVASLAAGCGLAVGLWLGGRREARRHQTLPFSMDDLGDYAGLAPLAGRLLANPVIRTYVARAAMKQVRKYLDS